jgi:DNA-binding transcriptional LysR family regulator
MALVGYGLAYLPEDQVKTHVADGRLIRVLHDWCPPFSGTTCTTRAAGNHRPLPCSSMRCVTDVSEAFQRLDSGRQNGYDLAE